jgi:hypothetical protein
LICISSGATKGGKQTYAPLEDRVPKTKPLTQEEALAKLAYKYFASRNKNTRQPSECFQTTLLHEAIRCR